MQLQALIREVENGLIDLFLVEVRSRDQLFKNAKFKDPIEADSIQAVAVNKLSASGKERKAG